jgi:hypothetical protein
MKKENSKIKKELIQAKEDREIAENEYVRDLIYYISNIDVID